MVSQPSKCLKFTAFREVCFVIHVEYKYLINKTNDLILNLTPENVTQHSRIE